LGSLALVTSCSVFSFISWAAKGAKVRFTEISEVSLSVSDDHPATGQEITVTAHVKSTAEADHESSMWFGGTGGPTSYYFWASGGRFRGQDAEKYEGIEMGSISTEVIWKAPDVVGKFFIFVEAAGEEASVKVFVQEGA
jgi:hypothetical protein